MCRCTCHGSFAFLSLSLHCDFLKEVWSLQRSFALKFWVVLAKVKREDRKKDRQEARTMSVCGGGGGALWVGCCQAAGTRRRVGGLQWLNRQCSRLDTPLLPLSALSFQQQQLQSRWRQGTRAVQDMRGDDDDLL